MRIQTLMLTESEQCGVLRRKCYVQKCKGPKGRRNSVDLKEKQAINLSVSTPREKKYVAEWKNLRSEREKRAKIV